MVKQNRGLDVFSRPLAALVVGAFCSVCGALAAPGLLEAGETWLEWGGGPHRSFNVDAPALAKKWPKDGPPRIWSRRLGEGYSAIVGEADRLYTMYSIREKTGEEKWALEGKEAVVCLNAKTGENVWEYVYDVPWAKDMNMEFGPGPHSTPLLLGDRLYTIGCTVKLHCLDKATGKVVWSKDLAKEYGASNLNRGYGASPLAYKNHLILPIGGEGTSVIALKADDGSLVWKNQNFSPTYASPIIIDVDGQDQLVTFTGEEVSGLNPNNGDLLWTHAQKTQYGANISTPVWCKDNILFISAAYGMGARGIQLTREGDTTTVKELWYNGKMKIHHGNAVTVGDYVYGSSGDFGPAFFAAVDIKTGEFAWKKRGFSKANCVLGDDKLIVLDEDGRLALTKIGPKKMSVLSKTQLCDRVAWTVPTLLGSTLYVRDRGHITAVDLSTTADKDDSRPTRGGDAARM